MMRGKTLTLMLAAIAAAVAAAVQESDDGPGAILRLVNRIDAGSPAAYAAAAETVARDAAAGHVLQQYVIALAQSDPALPEGARISAETRRRYLEESRGKIRELAEKRDNAFAWYLLARESNDEQMLKRAADGGNIQALNMWGAAIVAKAESNPLLSGEERDQMFAKAFACFSRASAGGDANAMFNLGTCYINGYGCEANFDKAFDCFKTAADAGHSGAINNIGGMFRDGVSVEKSPVLAARWFAKSAGNGNAYGMLNYGQALLSGSGVERDAPRGAGMIRRSAELGCVEAVNAYGRCLADGVGVEADPKAAVSWFRNAAQRGDPDAMENLAWSYERGFGGLEKSVKEATVWKVRARAARGDRNAMVWLSQNGYDLM